MMFLRAATLAALAATAIAAPEEQVRALEETDSDDLEYACYEPCAEDSDDSLIWISAKLCDSQIAVDDVDCDAEVDGTDEDGNGWYMACVDDDTAFEYLFAYGPDAEEEGPVLAECYDALDDDEDDGDDESEGGEQ